jgi:hypothetical protein
MMYVVFGLLLVASVIYWLVAKYLSRIGFRNYVQNDAMFRAEAPRLFFDYRRLVAVVMYLPYVLWISATILSFLHSLMTGFLVAVVVVVLWIALSQTPTR